MPVTDKFGICKQTKHCTLIPPTHSRNLTRTNENPNGKIVTHTQNIALDQIPPDDVFRAKAHRVHAR